jgi:hypothetical protein
LSRPAGDKVKKQSAFMEGGIRPEDDNAANERLTMIHDFSGWPSSRYRETSGDKDHRIVAASSDEHDKDSVETGRPHGRIEQQAVQKYRALRKSAMIVSGIFFKNSVAPSSKRDKPPLN